MRNHKIRTPGNPRLLLTLAGLVVAALFISRSFADKVQQPYPEFVAYYGANANGFDIGNVTISLKHAGDNRYIYRQESTSTGVAALFGSKKSIESSLWQLRDGRIQPLEYQSQRKGGDDDDNSDLIFDWQNGTVKNVGAGDHWQIDLPKGTLDRLVMQLAMLFDLRAGTTKFDYQVPRQGRIKDYRFELQGEDKVELTSGVYRTLKVGRTNDDKDQSWVWSAPELDYFPVRFLKKKNNGIKVELVLLKLDFAPFGKATSLEVPP